MSMFIEIFLMLCIMAQPKYCGPVQQFTLNTTAERTNIDNKSTIFSLINDAGNCTVYSSLNSESNYLRVKEYCERPLPEEPGVNAFVSYDVALCMVLYDAAKRVCAVEHKEVNKGSQNSSSDFSCDNMIKKVPESSHGVTKYWVTFLRAKFQNITNCEQACIQDNLINSVCEYILRANILAQNALVSSKIADTSHAENATQVNSQGRGKVKNTNINKDKASEKKSVEPPSASDLSDSIRNAGTKNADHIHNMTVTIKSPVVKSVDLSKANGSTIQSGFEKDGQNNTKKQTEITNGDVQDGVKQQQLLISNTQHDDKETHGTDSNAQNNMKQQPHAISNNSQLADLTLHNAAVSLPEVTGHIPETEKHDDNTRKVVTSDSSSNTAPQSEDNSSVDVPALDPGMPDQGDDNENPFVPTDQNIPDDDEDPNGEKINLEHSGEQSEQIEKEAETHQEESETSNTAQFGQIEDANDSHFYAYFMTMVVVCIIGYLVFHNKQKILALALEGRSRRGTRRRPNTSAYRKLDSNLEEAVTSACSTSVTHVIY